jgi:acetyltransferase
MKVSIYNDGLSRIYEKYGLKSVKSVLAKDAKEAERVAVSVGFPVALKIESPDILHKTDIGGVELNIYSEEEVCSGNVF